MKRVTFALVAGLLFTGLVSCTKDEEISTPAGLTTTSSTDDGTVTEESQDGNLSTAKSDVLRGAYYIEHFSGWGEEHNEMRFVELNFMDGGNISARGRGYALKGRWAYDRENNHVVIMLKGDHPAVKMLNSDVWEMHNISSTEVTLTSTKDGSQRKMALKKRLRGPGAPGPVQQLTVTRPK
jgi:hypothetical protein